MREKIKQALENIVSHCELEQYITVTDDMFTVAAAQILGISETSIRDEEYEDDIKEIAEGLEKMVRNDSRLEWWEQGAQFVNKHGKLVTLDLPVILPAGRFETPEEAQELGE